MACTSIGREGQPLEEECVKGRGKLAIPEGLIAEMKVKRKGKVTKARCSPQKNGSGIDDFSDDE